MDLKESTYQDSKIYYRSDIDYPILIREIFDEEIYKFESMKESPLIIDCGSNIGISVLYFKKLYPNAKIIAFEPDPDNYELLLKNIEANNLKDVTTYNLALSDKAGQIDLFYESDKSSTIGNTISLQWGDRKDFIKLSVKADKLSAYITDKDIDFLKLDVEGVEYQVFQDIKGFLSRVENLAFEYHHTNAIDDMEKYNFILDLLKKEGFTLTTENIAMDFMPEKYKAWLDTYKPSLSFVKGKNMNKDKILKQNSEAWNTAAKNFFGSEALPLWFPFDKGEFKDLIGEIEGKTFLEIACGSGHSMKYLLDNGAKFVHGIDFSSEQINYAKELNKIYIDEGRAKLLLQPMENKLELTGLDIVFSVYGLGWTQEPEIVLKNIFNSLKDGGKFIWSWDHPLCTISEIQDGKVFIIDSYNGTNLVQRNLFGNDVHQLVSSISHWFEVIQKTGFKINQFIEAYPTEIPDSYNDHGGYYAREKIEKIPTSMIWVLEK